MKKITFLMVTALVIGCASPSGSSGDGSTVGGGAPSSHDGTMASPVALTLGSAQSGKVGSYSDSSNSESYYQFNSGSHTSILFSISGSSTPHNVDGTDDYFVHVYPAASGFSGTAIAYPTVTDSIAPYLTVAANTDYYVRVLNQVSAATTYSIKVEAQPTTLNDGTVGFEIPLNLGVGKSTFTSNPNGTESSYYTFNTVVA
jgi:hypothetical protein